LYIKQVIKALIFYGIMHPLVASSNHEVLSARRPKIPHPAGMVLGLALMFSVPIYLWKIHPLAERRLRQRTA
jgi:hypothetical protein